MWAGGAIRYPGFLGLFGAFLMKKQLPRRHELAAFVVMAVICAVIVAVTGKYDVGLAVLGAPIFLVAALMGFRRSLETGAGAEQGEDAREIAS
jgi:hypothetical protein